MPVFGTPTVWIALMNVFNNVAVAQAITATLNFIAVTAASMGASKLLQKKPPGFGDASLADRTQMVRSPISARQIIYGETRVSGTLVYISTTGAKNEYLHFIVAIAGHEVEAIGDVYFNDELALSDPNYTGGGSAGTGRFAGYAEIYKKYGGDTQTVETNLETATAGLTNGKWTSNHRLRGIAYLYVRLIWDEKVWAGGIPNVAVMVRGKKVWDPRTSTVGYSANAALCLRDYLTDTRLGMAMDGTEMDDTAFIAAANICDEQVQILPASPTTYEKRYEANGVLYTSASPDENIGKLLSAMGGLIAYSGGKVVPYAGGYRIPTVTLSEGDFAGAVQIQTKTSARDRVNAVKGVFVSAKSEWQPTDFPPLVSSTYYAEDGNIRYYRDVVLPMTTSSSCAQRLARIELRRARQELTMTARFKLDAMQLRAGDTVMITNAKFGWTNKVFEVMDWHFASDGEPPQLTIEMTLRETASAVYDWSVTDEIEMPNTPTTTLPNPFTLAAPTNLSLVADGTTQLVQADGTALPRIKVSWSAPAEEFIQSGGSVGIDYKESTSTTYLTWATVPGDRTLEYISSDVKIGLGYNVRIYGLSYFQVATSYITASVTVVKDTTAPSAPTSLTANIGTGRAVSLDWADNTEPDLSEYGVYRNTSGTTPANANTDKIAEVRASRFVDTEVAVGTTYYYWVTAYDFLENVSGFSNRAQAIASGITAGSVDSTAPATPDAFTLSTIPQTAYFVSDGTVRSRFLVDLPSVPSGAAWMNLLIKPSTDTNYGISAVITSGNVAYPINGLSPGVSYDIALQAFSNFGYSSARRVVSGSPHTSPTAVPSPSVPTGLIVSAGTGQALSLDWDDNNNLGFSEYGIYRNTTSVTPSNSTVDKIAEVRASRFVDTDVVLSTTYYYWVNSYDVIENVSGFSTRAQGTPSVVTAGSVDSTPPATPNAPTFASETTYLAADGTALARISLTAPAMPARGALMTILFRRSGANQWQVGNQIDSGSVGVSIDDLTTGQEYQFAARALSSFDISSSVSSILTRTAPTYSTAPAAPTAVTLASPSDSTTIPPAFTTVGRVAYYAMRVSWTPSTSPSVVGYQVGSATTYLGTVNWDTKTVSSSYYYYYTLVLSAAYIAVRAVDRSGNFSTEAWSAVNVNTVVKVASGSMAAQESNDVEATGLKTGGGSSTRQVNVRYEVSEVKSLTGGAATETISIDTTNRGFSAKPDAGWIQCASNSNIVGVYDFDNASNSSTTSYFNLRTVDGTNISTGNQRFSIGLVDYS